jgi:sugar (pentulose or hexulose) kinase
MEKTDGYLGIDLGTQGLSIIFTNKDLKVLAKGEGSYDFVAGLEEGCYEQRTEDWQAALVTAMKQIYGQLKDSFNVLSIGISGQMHGEVLCDESGKCLSPVRLWCDSRNGAEGEELTHAFGVKVPRRATAARFLWTARNQPELAKRVRHLTTPAGWIAFVLTGKFYLGIGDASGMFPIDADTLDYDQTFLRRFDEAIFDTTISSFVNLLPKVRRAGQDGGRLNAHGAKLMGLPEGVLIAPAEGDQVAALAGGLIGAPGMISCSFGTSVCANTVGDHAFRGVSPAIDQFCAADGKPICMVWLINGTTFLNAMVRSYGSILNAPGDNKDATFATIMRHVVDAPNDCGGLLALGFLDDEPGLGVVHGNSGLIVGFNQTNATPGNICKAALLCVMFNLRLGQQVLDDQGFQRAELNLSGGLCKTPECGQMLADVFNAPVLVYDSADEGCCWGACILAKYRHDGPSKDWSAFLCDIAETLLKHRIEPNAASVATFNQMFERYKKLIALQPNLREIVTTSA